MKSIHNLVIVSHVIHYQHNNQLFAYGPYTREINLWADLFPQIMIAAPLRVERPPADCLPFSRLNIDIAPQLQRGGESWRKKLFQFLSLPLLWFGLAKVMCKADAVLVRCPGNLGLLGVMLAPIFLRYRVAKYAGQWNGYKGEPWSYRLTRLLLRSHWWDAPVLVYGNWPHQPKHVHPVFATILESKQVDLARKSGQGKELHQPIRILFVGRLTTEKNAQAVLDGLRILQQKQIRFDCRIIGDGPMRKSLEQQAASMGLAEQRIIVGAVPFDSVLEYYTWADVLVLISKTEGWPKAIVEGMAFGLLCIGSREGLIPQMLADGRGITVEAGDPKSLAEVLESISLRETNFSRISTKAAEWGQQYSLEGLQKVIYKILQQECGWDLLVRELRTP